MTDNTYTLRDGGLLFGSEANAIWETLASDSSHREWANYYLALAEYRRKKIAELPHDADPNIRSFLEWAEQIACELFINEITQI